MTAPPAGTVVPRAFYDRDARQVGPELLNKILVAGSGERRRAGRIVEVEAYVDRDDPASHSRNGPTARNRTMFGPPGHLYVYFSYGIHWCANAVCGPEGRGAAVLLRALVPLEGVAAMRACRPAARRDRDLCSGPAKLCQALGLTGAADGADLVAGDREVTIVDDGTPPPDRPDASTRVGIGVGTEHPWRWYVADPPTRPHLSRVPPSS